MEKEEKEALDRIANSLEKMVGFYEHPEQMIQNMMPAIRDAVNVRSEATLPGAVAPLRELPENTEGVTLTVRLSEEEKSEITNMVIAEFEQQADAFKGFIADSLSELPEKQLKRIGEHLKKGEQFKLRRRAGCVHLDFGYADEEFYLKL